MDKPKDFFDFEEDFEDFQTIDEDILLSFLNEYYVVNPEKLPKVEII